MVLQFKLLDFVFQSCETLCSKKQIKITKYRLSKLQLSISTLKSSHFKSLLTPHKNLLNRTGSNAQWAGALSSQWAVALKNSCNYIISQRIKNVQNSFMSQSAQVVPALKFKKV